MSDENQIKIRLPDDVMAKLQQAIRKSLRSIPMEIAWRLRESFKEDKDETR